MKRESEMRLPVRLSPEELQSRGQKLARDWAEVDAEEESLKAQFKSAMESVKERRHGLIEGRNVVRSGEEMRLVPVRREADIEGSCWRVYRQDTGAFGTTEEMTPGEYRDAVQPNLFDGARAWGMSRAVENTPPTVTDAAPAPSSEEASAEVDPLDIQLFEPGSVEERFDAFVCAMQDASSEGAGDKAVADVFVSLGGLPFQVDTIPEANLERGTAMLKALPRPEVAVEKKTGRKKKLASWAPGASAN